MKANAILLYWKVYLLFTWLSYLLYNLIWTFVLYYFPMNYSNIPLKWSTWANSRPEDIFFSVLQPRFYLCSWYILPKYIGQPAWMTCDLSKDLCMRWAKRLSPEQAPAGSNPNPIQPNPTQTVTVLAGLDNGSFLIIYHVDISQMKAMDSRLINENYDFWVFLP